MLNKENINPSANAKSDKFFCETVSRNVLLLCNSKEALLQATESTRHGNRHSTIGSYRDVCYLVKLFTKEAVFYEQLGKGDSRSDLPNLFANGNVLLARRILLSKYITNSRSNWVASTRTEIDNSENDLATGADNVNTDIVEGRARKMEMDYN